MIVLLCFLAGVACIATGCALIYLPAAWIAGGAGLIAVAFILAQGGDNNPRYPRRGR